MNDEPFFRTWPKRELPSTITRRLKACPFCHSRDFDLINLCAWEVQCKTCLAEGPKEASMDAAIAAWNDRTGGKPPSIQEPERIEPETLRIAYASDLHLEHNDYIPMDGLGNADVLILAGDIGTNALYYDNLLKRLRTGENGEKGYSGPIFIVLGNHEYDQGLTPEVRRSYEKVIAQYDGVHLLDDAGLFHKGVRFLGTTLWSDRDLSNTSEWFVERAKQEMVARRKSLEWLNERMRVKWKGPTVVISHHAPSLNSLCVKDQKQAKAAGGSSLYTPLDDQITRWKPTVWIHGHVHGVNDYQIGATRILSNAWGQHMKREYRRVEITAHNDPNLYATLGEHHA